MRLMSRTLVLLAAIAATVSAPAHAQATHVIRMVADPPKNRYRFEPAELTVHPNDVLVFRVASGAPHSVVFEGQGLSPGVRAALNAAMPGRSGDLSSPLLTATGKEYRIVVPQIPPGVYPFYCLPHRAYDMRGTLTVK